MVIQGLFVSNYVSYRLNLTRTILSVTNLTLGETVHALCRPRIETSQTEVMKICLPNHLLGHNDGATF